eukprot:TRINITY_DN2209_c0_g1_i1.p1 TRINITY_DN2209_c0_g1~~TRINITY_DN2209_c0_g1_i1.p1  ORF type:complete len:529 (+),score=90.23 TRINITY_DN2209_c0_g1_i1:163-1587(+)
MEDAMNVKLDLLIAKAPEAERASFSKEMDGFRELFSRYIRSRGEVIDWSKINPPRENLVVPHSDLRPCPDDRKQSLANKLCVLKLNGGLGTTMGCKGPKSVIEVHSGLTFLDLAVQQIEILNTELGADVPLILMNSFNTHDETLKVIHKYRHSKATVHTFNQSRFPRILKDSLLPMPESPKETGDGWYPPGHGDVFRAFANSGLLDEMIKQGKEYVFIANVDNIGATVDFDILNDLLETGCEFAMEVTDKTRADIKGGTLIDYEGQIRLLEIAQCPPAHVEDFKSIKKFKIFNTNNIWVSLKAIARVLRENTLRQVDIIVNPKKSDNGLQIVQLETAVGAAIQFFDNAKGINVHRRRFLPVKNTSDLFIVQSNLYTLESGELVMNPKRLFETVPLVKLGENFTKVSNYMSRLAGIPDILELDQLTVSGDVTFGSNITLKGTVIIVANHGNRIDIPSGSVLENKVVSGNLRILDH